MYRGLLLCVLSLVVFPAALHADPLEFTTEMRADYQFSLLGGTVLNPGPTTPFIPFRALGNLTFQLDPSLNDPSRPTTVPFVDAMGLLNGIPPSPAFTLPHTIDPNVQFLSGTLTNIQRDGSGHVTSADISDLSMRWELIGMNPAFNVRLYTKDGLPFDATGVTIPFQLGTVLAGAAPFDVYLDLGNPATDPLVAIGEDRTLTAVPEPSSFILFGVAAGTFLIGLPLHRNARQRATLEPVCQPVSE
jgi:hypothetical protein